jgi:hypothetical protein
VGTAVERSRPVIHVAVALKGSHPPCDWTTFDSFAVRRPDASLNGTVGGAEAREHDAPMASVQEPPQFRIQSEYKIRADHIARHDEIRVVLERLSGRTFDSP